MDRYSKMAARTELEVQSEEVGRFRRNFPMFILEESDIASIIA